jgi:MoxR-like ATPase
VIDGRDYVTPDDVNRVAVPVLAHRLSLTPGAWAAGTDPVRVVAGVVEAVPGPPSVPRSAARA